METQFLSEKDVIVKAWNIGVDNKNRPKIPGHEDFSLKKKYRNFF